MIAAGRSTVVAVSVLLLSRHAWAQTSDEDRARELFGEAVAALDKGDYRAACPRFRAAMRLYASPSTELNIGRCFEHEGKLGSAWVAYKNALELNRGTKDERRREGLEKLATEALAGLEPRVPKLRVVVAAAPPGLLVMRDAGEVSAPSFGRAVPLNAGILAIEASAPGYETWQRTVRLEEGKTTEVSITLIRSDTPDTGTKSAAGIPVWAWVTGGLGVALGVAAVAFRVDWGNMDGKQEAAGCGADLQSCSRETYTTLEADNARKSRDRALFAGLGAASLAGIAAGIVGVVVGSVKKREPRIAAIGVTPWFDGSTGGASLRGVF